MSEQETKPKKKSKGTSPTQRSLKLMRERGYTCAIVEHWNSFRKIRSDMFGFVDIECIRANETVYVQTTSGSNVSERIHKIAGIQAAHVILESPTRRIVVHGWRKVGDRGKRKLWDCREVEITKDMLNNPPQQQGELYEPSK